RHVDDGRGDLLQLLQDLRGAAARAHDDQVGLELVDRLEVRLVQRAHGGGVGVVRQVLRKLEGRLRDRVDLDAEVGEGADDAPVGGNDDAGLDRDVDGAPLRVGDRDGPAVRGGRLRLGVLAAGAEGQGGDGADGCQGAGTAVG